MFICRGCEDEHDDDAMTSDGVCGFCASKLKFAAFAKRHGLTHHPDPTGERYVYDLDGKCAGKKVECISFMDELWDALVRAVEGDETLLLNKPRHGS